ncbi:MAG: hypothetical protein NT166_27170 [Candidatus Aminicenantes bacterium]|nr:hypothetical protein [Candidatus Aminicenantes bacterium]
MITNKCKDNGCGNAGKMVNVNYNTGATGGRKTGCLDSSLPPLPEPVGIPSGFTSFKDSFSTGDSHRDAATTGSQGVFLEGCYYIRLTPTSLHIPSRYQYEGTMRIQRIGGTILASGDLYNTDICKSPTFCPSLSDNNRKNNIPVFPRKQYAYYLRIIDVQEGESESPNPAQTILLDMEHFRFDHSRGAWGMGEALTAELKFSTAPDGIHYWLGNIRTRANVVLGQMAAVWISPYLRQAVVEIDHAAESECPMKNEKGDDWQAIFRKAGWDITLEVSDENVKEPDDLSWSNSELHKAMLDYRKSIDLDNQWRYHLLAVHKLDDDVFGMMYDNTISGIDNIPREGAAIASHVIFTGDDCWGKCKNARFGQILNPYFRTAIHEIGHALMLYHPDNPYENYIMQKTIQIAHNAAAPVQFPDNIEWSFSPRDIRLLGHLPDIAIRPGGVSFGTPYDRLPVNARDGMIEADDLELKVSPLHDVVPFGAPVRVNFSLINRSQKETKIVPGKLSMKTGQISGRVIDPLGTTRDFATIMRHTGEIMPKELEAGKSISHSVTLLWGTQGPLFLTSGYYRIVIELNWHIEGVMVRVSGSTSIMVTPPKDDEQSRAALKIFSTPEAFLALSIGGDHLEEGFDAIHAAAAHPVLMHHYKLFEAKRSGQRFFKRKPDLKQTAEMIDEHTVMAPAEVIRLAKVLRNFVRETEKEVVEKMASILMSKAKEVGVEDKVEAMISIYTNGGKD